MCLPRLFEWFERRSYEYWDSHLHEAKEFEVSINDHPIVTWYKGIYAIDIETLYEDAKNESNLLRTGHSWMQKRIDSYKVLINGEVVFHYETGNGAQT